MRPRRWIPLVLIWTGVLLLAQGSVSQWSGGTGVLVLGQRRDLGVLAAGQQVQVGVTVLNLSGVPLEIEAMPSCGCTVLSEVRSGIGVLGWKRLGIAVDTSGMGAGSYGRLVRLRLRRGQRVWDEDVLLRFSVAKEGNT
ncbi:MAG: hypothetical protein K6U75_16660, partial [Firmicutes bacterium]|nr:hypothetical protein [Bacillota bacterium]